MNIGFHSHNFLTWAFLCTSVWLAGCSGSSTSDLDEESSRSGQEEWEARDQWQSPDRIIHHLDIVTGDYVADIGCNEGYMTVKLAQHVGNGGRVFAVDIRKSYLLKLEETTADMGFENVVLTHGEEDDPNLPGDELDAVLFLNTYHEVRDYLEMLKQVRKAMLPDGRLVIVEPIKESVKGKPRSDQEEAHTIGIEFVKQDFLMSGFRITEELDHFVERPGTGGTMWLLVAVKN